MPSLTSERFSFVSFAMPEENFEVVHFSGFESLSKCYEFEITLVSENYSVDLEKIIDFPAVLTVYLENGDPVPFHGIIAEFDQMQEVLEHTFYRARLVPKLWRLTQTIHNQIFLDRTIPEIMEAVLADCGLTTLDYELHLQGDYSARREFVCQYRESHFNFFCRWLEWAGMYFYFEQNDAGEKVIITDNKIAHTAMPQGRSLTYAPPSGLEELHQEKVIRSLVCRQKKAPVNVRLKDYNYRHPSLDISGSADAASNGVGEVYIYGDHFQTPKEGDILAKIRAEELLCRKKVFIGESGASWLRPGFTFEMSGHYRDDFNSQYLTTEIEHEGNQAGYLTDGFKEALAVREEEPFYRNSFTAIPAEVQFRPERISEKPRFYGSMNAKIDAEGSGKYAELDDQGRYKVILPFDLSSRQDGKASAWIRMAQPYAGSEHGMHFPLHKGVEVLLTFIDGDPDRPIIAGAVPNPETASRVNSNNPSRAGFQTAGGGSFHFEDMEGKQRVVMHAGDDNSVFSMGHGSPPEWLVKSDFGTLFAKLVVSQFSGLRNYSIVGSQKTLAVGWKKLALLMAAIEEVVKGIPELTKIGDDSGDAKQWAEGITSIAMPIIALAANYVQAKMMEKWVVDRFKNTAQYAIPDKPLFFVGGMGEGSIMKMDDSGKDIWLYTEAGGIYQLADDYIHIGSGDSVNIDGNKVTLWAAEDVNLKAHGAIKLEQKEMPGHPPTQSVGVQITSDEKDILIATKHGALTMFDRPNTVLRNDERLQICVGVPLNNSLVMKKKGGETTLKAERIELNADTNIKFEHGNTSITLSGKNFITAHAKKRVSISADDKVRIQRLTVKKKTMEYRGKSAKICKVLKVKG